MIGKKRIAVWKRKILNNNLSLFKWIIAIFHLVGLIGLSSDNTRPYFQIFTPFHLLLSTGVLLLFHKSWGLGFIIFAFSSFFIGFFAEVVGIQTGLLFGNYWYGTVLGPHLFEVPILIGVNWFLLVYLSGNLFHKKIMNDWLGAIFGAVAMTIMDIFIEPVAVALGYWYWEGDTVPLSNYVGWFLVAFIIHMIYRRLSFEKDNELALFLFINLAAFFGILNLIL